MVARVRSKYWISLNSDGPIRAQAPKDKVKELELRISDLAKAVASAKEGIATLAEEIEGLNDGIKALDKQESGFRRRSTLHPSCLPNFPSRRNSNKCDKQSHLVFRNYVKRHL